MCNMEPNQEFEEKVEKEMEINFKQVTKLFEEWEFRHLKREFVEKVLLLVISALGFVTALAWGEALKISFEELFGKLETIHQRFLYAGLITVIAVIISLLISKIFLRKKILK